MPVFQKDNISILFVHVPKAGGTTIEHFFRQQNWQVSFFDGGEVKPSINPLTWCSPQHFHAEILHKIFNVKRFTYCFAIVREPISRIKSEVRWRMQYFNAQIEPDEWIDQALKAFPRNPFIHDNHIRPQSEFLFDGLEVHYLEDGLDRVIDHLVEKFGDHLRRPAPLAPMMASGGNIAVNLSAERLYQLADFYAADYRDLRYPQ